MIIVDHVLSKQQTELCYSVRPQHISSRRRLNHVTGEPHGFPCRNKTHEDAAITVRWQQLQEQSCSSNQVAKTIAVLYHTQKLTVVHKNLQVLHKCYLMWRSVKKLNGEVKLLLWLNRKVRNIYLDHFICITLPSWLCCWVLLSLLHSRPLWYKSPAFWEREKENPGSVAYNNNVMWCSNNIGGYTCWCQCYRDKTTIKQ